MEARTFVKPERKIFTAFDIDNWYKSRAYKNYIGFLRRINNAVIGVPTTSKEILASENVTKLIHLLDTFEGWIREYPPEDMGAQRFGNKSYKKWHFRLEEEIGTLLSECLPHPLKDASIEMSPYLLDSFGNSTRIDYGSGHEANFLIFLYCLNSLGVLTTGLDDKAIVLRIFHRYLKLVRQLQIEYRMEPAGSRGVHAIDDFQFAPFIFGSAQLINNPCRLIPDYYLRTEMVEMYQENNLFFEAIDYINKTKTGPFHEHSNQLFNISVVPTWEKINEGMFKMYEGEVLKKFPVVQHLLFGQLFSFEKNQDGQTAQSEISGFEKIARSQHPSKLGAIPE